MPDKMLVDTDILIDFLRGTNEAVSFFEKHTGHLSVSVISVGELFAGVREGRERHALDKFVDSLEVVSLTLEIAKLGGLYRRDYGKSHGVGLPDALIAATAQREKLALATFNQKHFPMVKNLIAPYQKIQRR